MLGNKRMKREPDSQGLAISLCLAKQDGDGDDKPFQKLLVLEVDQPQTLMTIHQAKQIHEQLGSAIAQIEAMSDDPNTAQRQYAGPRRKTVDLYPDGTSDGQEKN